MPLAQFSQANRIAERAARLGRFPHMSPADTKVWAVALAYFGHRFRLVEYDVRLGGKTGTVTEAGEVFRQMWDRLIQKRVDVVAHLANEVWVIEVKPICTMSAIGQVETYAWLYAKEKGFRGQLRKVIVCNRIDEDLPELLREKRISVYAFALTGSAGGALLSEL